MRIDGRSSPQARGDAVAMFQGDPDCRVALLAIKAAGVCFSASPAVMLCCLLQQSVLIMLLFSTFAVVVSQSAKTIHASINASKSTSALLSKEEKLQVWCAPAVPLGTKTRACGSERGLEALQDSCTCSDLSCSQSHMSAFRVNNLSYNNLVHLHSRLATYNIRITAIRTQTCNASVRWGASDGVDTSGEFVGRRLG